MRIKRAPSAASIVGFTAIVCLLTFAGVPTRGQQSPSPGPPPRGRDPFTEMRERRQREAQLRSVEIVGSAEKIDLRAAEAGAEQLRGDFKSIQILRNNLVRRLLSDQPLDYKVVAAESERINKLAGRLKTHLMREAPADEKKEREKQVEFGDDWLRESLVTLCQRIDSFTESPVFKVPDVIDVDQSAQAGRDLRDIIRLSLDASKTAKRLSKARGK